MIEPKILFEDTHLVVLAKPAGLLSQGEHTGDVNVVDWLRARFGRPYVGLVHRLDRNTSGLMVVAKRTKSANRLTEALRNGHLERTYLAWVHGRLERPARWRHFLLKDETANRSRVVVEGTAAGAREAVLSAKPVRAGRREGDELTLVEFTLETGRSHQIRAQAAHERHPLLGDRKYGSRDSFTRPALHSHRIKFPHPMSSETLQFEEALPDDLRF